MPEMPHFNNWNATLKDHKCHTSALSECGIPVVEVWHFGHYPTADKRCDLQFSFLPAIRPVSINNNHHETDERKDK